MTKILTIWFLLSGSVFGQIILKTPTLWDETDVLELSQRGMFDEYAVFEKWFDGDISVRLKAKAGENDNFFIMVAMSSDTTDKSYYVQFRDGFVNVYRDGLLASDKYDIVTSKAWQWVEVGISKDDLFARYNGRELKVKAPHKGGRIGFGSFRGTAAFDSLTIEADGQTYFVNLGQSLPEFSGTIKAVWEYDDPVQGFIIYLSDGSTVRVSDERSALLPDHKDGVHWIEATAIDTNGVESVRSRRFQYVFRSIGELLFDSNNDGFHTTDDWTGCVLFFINKKYGWKQGDSKFDSVYDLDKDGFIGLGDFRLYEKIFFERIK